MKDEYDLSKMPRRAAKFDDINNLSSKISHPWWHWFFTSLTEIRKYDRYDAHIHPCSMCKITYVKIKRH